MEIKQIHELIDKIHGYTQDVEDLYEENGGEVTYETEGLEERIAQMKELLQDDGIDALGRWLAAKQHQIEVAKAEREIVNRRIKGIEATIDYIKSLVGTVLDTTGETAAKGYYYTFKRGTSTKRSVLQEEIDKAYLDEVRMVAKKVGLPDCIQVVLKTTTGALADAGLAEYYVNVETAPSVTFLKPNAAKKNEGEE